MGNGPAHAFAYDLAVAAPGLLVLHDLVLFHSRAAAFARLRARTRVAARSASSRRARRPRGPHSTRGAPSSSTPTRPRASGCTRRTWAPSATCCPTPTRSSASPSRPRAPCWSTARSRPRPCARRCRGAVVERVPQPASPSTATPARRCASLRRAARLRARRRGGRRASACSPARSASTRSRAAVSRAATHDPGCACCSPARFPTARRSSSGSRRSACASAQWSPAACHIERAAHAHRRGRHRGAPALADRARDLGGAAARAGAGTAGGGSDLQHQSDLPGRAVRRVDPGRRAAGARARAPRAGRDPGLRAAVGAAAAAHVRRAHAPALVCSAGTRRSSAHDARRLRRPSTGRGTGRGPRTPADAGLLAACGGSAPRSRARDFPPDQGAEPKQYREYCEVRQRGAGGKGPLWARSDFRRSDFRHRLLGPRVLPGHAAADDRQRRPALQDASRRKACCGCGSRSAWGRPAASSRGRAR